MPRRKTANAADTRMQGFPPDPASQVTLANWQDPPNQRWAFQHMREVIPSHPIPAGTARPLPERPSAVGHITVARLDGSTGSVDDVLRDTWTDALVVIHDGQLVEERYLSGMTAKTPHLLMSVSKSIVGCVAGTLVEQGLLSPDRPVSAYVPEIAGSGYAGATVRHLLDMRTGVLFREAYTVPDAEVRVMERSMGWRPSQVGDPVGAYAYLTTLGTEGPHGDQFTYRSADTDMLGWVCERASGTRMADLVSERIWVPMGAEQDAEITCDAVGTAIHDGGISATARDLARFGQLLLDDGRVGQTQVIPEKWLADSLEPGSRRSRRVRELGERAGPARRLVSQPVLVRAGKHRRRTPVSGHPRSDGPRRPGDPDGGRQAVVLAGGAERRPSHRHGAGVRRGRRAPGQGMRLQRTNRRPSRSMTVPRRSGRTRVSALKAAPRPGTFAKMPCGPRTIRPVCTS